MSPKSTEGRFPIGALAALALTVTFTPKGFGSLRTGCIIGVR